VKRFMIPRTAHCESGALPMDEIVVVNPIPASVLWSEQYRALATNQREDNPRCGLCGGVHGPNDPCDPPSAA
jgi:hypothetical protein